MRGRQSNESRSKTFQDYFLNRHQPGDTLFLYDGSLPSQNQDILLFPGWNIVGFPSLSNKNHTAALNNLVFGSQIHTISWFDAACNFRKEIREEDEKEVGKGYWIHAKTECIWEV